MEGLFPGYNNIIGSKVIVIISSHRKLFWSFSWGQKWSWRWWERKELFLKGFHFIPLLHSSWKWPQVHPQNSCWLPLPQHFFFYSSPLPSVLCAEMESRIRTGRFQDSTDERGRNHNMFWGHDWCSTWSSTEVAQVRQVELLGEAGMGRQRVGHQALFLLHLIILFWPRPKYIHSSFCFFKPKPCKWIIETFKGVMSGNSWRLI